jgi:hypothetical protein
LTSLWAWWTITLSRTESGRHEGEVERDALSFLWPGQS